MQKLVWFLILLLVVLHQDNWFWEDATLVFGFMPIGLFYHACISLAAATVWFMATRYCWPADVAPPIRGGPAPESGAARLASPTSRSSLLAEDDEA